MDKNKNAQNDFVSVKSETEVKPNNKEVKNNKKKNGKPSIFKRIGEKIKDIFSELKKVSWPTFAKVVKQTGVVLVVVLAFLIVITAFDFGLEELLKLISSK